MFSWPHQQKLCACHAGLLFSGMAVVSLLLVMPASVAADKLGRKWTIVPSCIGLAAALGLMAAAGETCSIIKLQVSSYKSSQH